MAEINPMTVHIATVVGCIALAASAPAAEPERVLRLQAELAAQQLSRYFETLKGFEFKVSQDTVVPSTGERYSETLSYASQGSLYWFDYTDDSEEVSTQSAFDGEYGQYLDKAIGRLAIQKNKRMSDFVAMDATGLLQPFSFFNADVYLGVGTKNSQPQIPSSDALGDMKQWVRRLSGNGVTLGTGEIRGRKVVIVSLPGGVPPGVTYPTTFTVYLDPQRGFYPIEWERLAADGSIREVYDIEEVEVEKTKSGIAFSYPQGGKSLHLLWRRQ